MNTTTIYCDRDCVNYKCKRNENNEWWWTSGGSWAVYYCLKKVELNNQLDK